MSFPKHVSPKNKAKKIGFLSVIILVIGSTIGAGIFFKASTVLQDTGNSLLLSIIAWIIAGIGVIAMGLALVEIVSARNDNLSIVGWCQTFAKRFFFKAAKNFMFWINTPLTYFVMPVYGILSFQNALHGFGVREPNFGTSADWAIWMVIALGFGVWYTVVSGLSSKAGNIQNWIITVIKFIPIIAVILVGFIFAGQAISDPQIFNHLQHGLNIKNEFNPWLPKEWGDAKAITFFGFSPIIGLIGSLAAIFFAFDGFYIVAGVQSEMKEPKKAPLAIVLGLTIITILSLLIAISMSIVGNGKLTGLTLFFQQKPHLMVFYGMMNLFVSIGTLGVANGFSMWIPRFIEDLIIEKEVPFAQKLVLKIQPKRPVVGIVYSLSISVPIVVIFFIIGGVGYIPMPQYWYPGSYYDGGPVMTNGLTVDNSMARLYSFCDLVSNWVGLMVFAFIVVAIIGGLANRKTKRVQTVKSKYFYGAAIVSVVIVTAGLIAQTIYPFVDLALIGRLVADGVPHLQQQIVGRVMTVVVFFIYVGMMVAPEWFTRSARRKTRIQRQATILKWKMDRTTGWEQKCQILADYYQSAATNAHNEQNFYRNLKVISREDTYQLNQLNQRVEDFETRFYVEISLLENHRFACLRPDQIKAFCRALKNY